MAAFVLQVPEKADEALEKLSVANFGVPTVTSAGEVYRTKCCTTDAAEDTRFWWKSGTPLASMICMRAKKGGRCKLLGLNA